MRKIVIGCAVMLAAVFAADQVSAQDMFVVGAGRKYKRTVVVSPVPGNPAASGAALRSAMNNLTDASATNPYLLKIEPGVYSMSASTLTMKPFVDIEGSGEGVTTITRGGDPASLIPTLLGAGSAEVRFLAVENTGGNTYALAIRNALPSVTPLASPTCRSRRQGEYPAPTASSATPRTLS